MPGSGAGSAAVPKDITDEMRGVDRRCKWQREEGDGRYGHGDPARN